MHDISAYDFLQANLHESLLEDNEGSIEISPDPNEDQADARPQLDEDTSTALLAFLGKQKSTARSGHLANVWSTSKSKNAKGARFMTTSDASPSKDDEIVINGLKYHQVQSHCIYYSVSLHKLHRVGSLVDRGANGGIAGDDVCIIEKSDQTVDVRGIDNHQITNIPIVTAGRVVKTQHGPVVAILHQYIYTGQGKTIHSSGQLKWYKNDVNDRSVKVASGSKCILTNDGYVIPMISIRDGLPYITPCPFTDEEWDSLLHVILTGDTDWDPSMLDVDLDEQETWFDAITNLPQDKSHSAFDEFGYYNKRIVVQNHDVLYSWDTSQHVINACVMVHT